MSSYLGDGRRPWQSHIDMYRKIPKDLLEGTGRGSIMSYISLVFMLILITSHTSTYYLSTPLVFLFVSLLTRSLLFLLFLPSHINQHTSCIIIIIVQWSFYEHPGWKQI